MTDGIFPARWSVNGSLHRRPSRANAPSVPAAFATTRLVARRRTTTASKEPRANGEVGAMDVTARRNKPCPCGSGKKFKLCHGAESAAPQAEVDPRSTTAQRLLRELYGERRKGAIEESFRRFTEELKHLDRRRVAPFFQTEATESAIATYALYDLTDGKGRTFSDRFVENHARTLAPAELSYIEALRASIVDFYEIRRVDRGRGLDLRNLRTGNDVFVHERLATETVVVYDVLAARVIEIAAGRAELFPPVLPFTQTAGRQVLADVRRAIRDGSSSLDLRGFLKAALPSVHARWVESRLGPSLRDMRTSEGEPLEPSTVRFRIPDRRRAVAALDASAAFERNADDDDSRYAFLGEDASGQFGEGRLLLGTLNVLEETLDAEVMARSRIDRLQKALAAADAGAFEFVSASTTDIEELARSVRAKGPRPPSRGDDIDPMEIPEVRERMMEIEEKWRRNWLDECIPALSGRTPREAARSSALRPKLIALLKEMQARDERSRRDGRPAPDCSWMWQELGLAP
jgi:hypothetical protein